MANPVKLHDFHPPVTDFREEVLAGLRKPLKELPCKLFYDERGSRLFERICELDEYYPTRTEQSIMQAHGAEMAAAAGARNLVIEYGSGSSDKTEILLRNLDDPVGYVPIDISREHLLVSSRRISALFPRLDVMPVCADYEQPFVIPVPTRAERSRLAYYPGSTIGNFHPHAARRFLARMAKHAGTGGRILIGVDLKKDPEILYRAYNDDSGVTAQFNLNILHRINRELDADFDVGNFRHHAYYNESQGRVEMHLVSLARQTVDVDGVRVELEEGESIWTESSYKYEVEEFAELVAQSGFELENVWTDGDGLFSVQMYSASRIPDGGS